MNDKTLGAYTRHGSPDYADGGVTAALIEQEAEEPDAEVRELRSVLAREIARGNALQDALEKAERERDEARATKDMHKRRADEERARADAAESRPLTPDAITDEMVERAFNLADGIEAVVINKTIMRDALIAALTEPPARPEGAEDWEDWLIHNLDYESLTDQQIEDLANRVAQRVNEERS